MHRIKALTGDPLAVTPGCCNRQTRANAADPHPEAALRAAPDEVKRGDKPDQAEHQTGLVAQPQAGQQVARRAAVHHPPAADLVAQRGQGARQRRLRRDGKDQPGEQGAQIAVGRQDQQTAGAAACQHHARTKDQSTHQSARQAALAGNLARRARVQQACQRQQLHPDHCRRKGEQPDTEFFAKAAMPELYDRRTQAKPRTLRQKPKTQTNDGATDGQHAAVTVKFNPLRHAHGYLRSISVSTDMNVSGVNGAKA